MTWTFTGVDVNESILEFAKKNAARNYLNDKISFVLNPDINTVYPRSLLEELALNDNDKFLLCNPPFFSSMQDAKTRREAKAHQPLASGNEIAFTEAVHADGGELGFVKKLISGSERLAKEHKVRLFSCLLGLKESFLEVQKVLNNLSSCFYAFELIKISHTSRWVIFWSFTDNLPVDQNGRLKIGSMTSGFQVVVECGLAEEEIVKMMSEYGSFEQHDDTYILTLSQNNWSRKARRSGPEPLSEPMTIEVTILEKELLLYFDTKSNALWDIFVGFVNHLRKRKQQ